MNYEEGMDLPMGCLRYRCDFECECLTVGASENGMPWLYNTGAGSDGMHRVLTHAQALMQMGIHQRILHEDVRLPRVRQPHTQTLDCMADMYCSI
mmetsp:Transcript_14638/g.26510  ORF Transcript_14638/g.26510 Transcript_14638/m.26510 type:complete len:95 (-) Transcript_14638:61-345(-)